MGLDLSQECLDLHAQIVCGECQPWGEHLLGAIRLNNNKLNPGDEGYIDGREMFLCSDFCQAYEAACGSLAAGYCEGHSAPEGQNDPTYCYPFERNFDPG
ncbi:unnamed protein product [Chrysoparadoxa australica]